MLFSNEQITDFTKIELTMNGMRGSEIYELICEGESANITLYELRYDRNGDRRIPLASAQTGTADIINLLNECKVIKWDKFCGANPRGVRDGWQFIFTAEVNGGRRLYASGSNNFPKHFRDFTNALNDMIRDQEDTK